MSVTIRPAVVADLPGVLELWRLGDAEPTHTDDLASLARLVDHDPGALLVADDGRHLVGSIVAGWDGWRGSIYRLVVIPDRRRGGLGRQLLAAAERHFLAVGAVRMQAIAVEPDARAVGFWRASGWRQQAERLRFVKG